MSYETVSEKRKRSLDGLLTDTSDIIELNETDCINYFNTLILDDLKKKVPDLNCWIAGGAIRDFFIHGRHLNDIDVYFPDPMEFAKLRKLLSQNSGVIYQNINCQKYHFYRENSDIHAIVDGIDHQYPIVVDLIRIHSISPEVTISNFDFTICSAAIHKDRFICHRNFKEDISERKLSPINPNPQSIFYRFQKFSKLGFTMSSEDIKILTEKYIKNDA